VAYNPNKDVMKKVVYDSIAKYKAEKEGIWWKKSILNSQVKNLALYKNV
jgi:hypothetical protein